MSKKLAAIALPTLVLISGAVLAKEMPRGTTGVLGGVSMAYSSTDILAVGDTIPVKNSTTVVTTGLDYYIANNLALTISGEATTSKYTYPSGSEYKSGFSMLYGGLKKPFEISEKLNFFVGFNLGFGAGNATTNGVVTSKTVVGGGFLQLGFEYFEGSEFSISPFIQFRSMDATYNDDPTNTEEMSGYLIGVQAVIYPPSIR